MKKISFFFCVVFASYIFFSCASFVWDKTIPPEKSATIWFLYYFPASYNGINVNSRNFTKVTLPAGAAEFSGDVKWTETGSYVTFKFFDPPVLSTRF